MEEMLILEQNVKKEGIRNFLKTDIQVCLINPSLDKKTTSKFPMSGVPLGIASLAAYLHKKNVQVEAIDSVVLKIDQLETA